MKFSIKDFSSICDQIRRLLRIWSHILEKSLIENFIFCVAVKPKDSLKFKLYKCLDYMQMARGKCCFVIFSIFIFPTCTYLLSIILWRKLPAVETNYQTSAVLVCHKFCLIREILTLKKYRLEYLAKLGSCFSYTLNAFLRLNVLLFSDGRMFLKTWILSFHLWLHKHFSWIHFWVELVSRGWILQHLNNHVLKKCYECLWESFLESFKNY